MSISIFYEILGIFLLFLNGVAKYHPFSTFVRITFHSCAITCHAGVHEPLALLIQGRFKYLILMNAGFCVCFEFYSLCKLRT